MKPSLLQRGACQNDSIVADAVIVATARPAPASNPARSRAGLALGFALLGLLSACGQKGPLFLADENGKPLPPATSSVYSPASPTTPSRTTSQNRPTFPTLP